MPKNEVGSAARLAAAAGLGLTLALGAAPVVAMAEGAERGSAAIASVAEETSSAAALLADGEADQGSDSVVASVDGVTYNTLAEALAAANGKTVLLQSDSTLESTIQLPSGVASTTIDLNGHILTVSDGVTFVSVPAGVEFTITDSSVDGAGAIKGSTATSFVQVLGALNLESGEISNAAGRAVLLNNVGSSFNMSGGSVSGTNEGVRGQNGAKISISGGVVSSTAENDINSGPLVLLGSTASLSGDAVLRGCSGVALYNYAIDANGSAVVDNIAGKSTPSHFEMSGGSIECELYALSGNNLQSATCSAVITGGTMKAEDTCIYWPMEGKLSIGGSAVIEGANAIEAKMGTISITGGTLKGTGTYESAYTGNGTASDGSAIKVVGQVYGASEGQFLESPALSLNVTDGSLESVSGNAISVYMAGVTDAYGEAGDLTASVALSDTVEVTVPENRDVVRVTFPSDKLNEFEIVDAGVKVSNTTITSSAVARAAALADGKTETGQTEAQDTLTLFSSISNAIAASDSDGAQPTTVTLLRDVTEDVSVPEGSNVSLNLNDKTLTGSIENNGTLELTGSGTIIGQITGAGDTTKDESSVSTYIASVGDTRYGTLAEALSAAASSEVNKTVELLANYECAAFTIPEGVTLDGNDHAITCNEGYSTGAFITVGEGADGVTIKDVVVSVPVAKDANKHAIQFYKNDGGTLDGVTINGGNWTSVIVNGATDVTVKDSVLNPNEGAYANIEYAMGGGVTTVPSLTVDGVKFKDGVTQVWADDATVSAIRDALPGVQTNDDVVEKIAGSVTNKNDGPIKVAVRLKSGNDSIVTETVQSVTNPPYNPGGSVSSGEQVKVSETDGGKVTVTPTRADEGDEVTITATPDEGQEVREVEVVDEDGKSVTVEAGEKDGEYVFTMPDGAVTVTVTFGCDGGELCPTHSFTDVDQSAWYHDAVDWAVENGVLNGYGEGGESLGPVADVTRAEMAQMLWNRAGRPEATADLSAFTDVDAGGWYAPALAWCVSEGVFSGYGDTFGTERTISREEAATVLWRLSGSPEADADLSGYGDASSVSDYATGAVEWAVSEGVLTGKGGVALDPQAGCTRGEVAAMMMRMAE